LKNIGSQIAQLFLFLDDTWFDSHDSAKKGCTDNSRRCAVDIPPSKGQVSLHVGSSDGFVNGALHLIARNIKDTKADYHQRDQRQGISRLV
jgi:hypothetical protein